MLTVEIGAARPAGIQRREQLVAGYEDVLRESLGLERGPGPIPNPVLRSVVGGILHVLYAQLRRGEHRRLRERLPDLVSWTTAYWPAPESVLRSLWDATPPKLDLTGGRAPGSLSLGASSSRLRRLPRGENGTSRSFVVHSQRERILDAVTNLTARSGYSALTVETYFALAPFIGAQEASEVATAPCRDPRGAGIEASGRGGAHQGDGPGRSAPKTPGQ